MKWETFFFKIIDREVVAFVHRKQTTSIIASENVQVAKVCNATRLLETCFHFEYIFKGDQILSSQLLLRRKEHSGLIVLPNVVEIETDAF